MEVALGTKQKDGSVVSIRGDVRRKHMAIFGKSGVGKTTLMRADADIPILKQAKAEYAKLQ